MGDTLHPRTPFPGADFTLMRLRDTFPGISCGEGWLRAHPLPTPEARKRELAEEPDSTRPWPRPSGPGPDAMTSLPCPLPGPDASKAGFPDIAPCHQ